MIECPNDEDCCVDCADDGIVFDEASEFCCVHMPVPQVWVESDDEQDIERAENEGMISG